jgi:thymidylate synthase
MIDKKYQELLQDILENGVEKKDRTGTGTISVFGRQIRHKMSDGFPLLTTKKMYWKGIVTELLWFLRGSTNIKYLLENNCHIWTGDAIKNYEKHNGEINGGPHTTKQEYFEDCVLNKEGFAGPIYGKQWRRWCTYPNEYGEYESNPIDQIQNSINLLKTDPDSRRNIVSAWNVGELDKMVLPPC